MATILGTPPPVAMTTEPTDMVVEEPEGDAREEPVDSTTETVDSTTETVDSTTEAGFLLFLSYADLFIHYRLIHLAILFNLLVLLTE